MTLVPRLVPRSHRFRYVAFWVTVCFGISVFILGLLLSMAPGTNHFDVAVFQVAFALFALALVVDAAGAASFYQEQTSAPAAIGGLER